MDRMLYMYMSGGNTCISTARPIWNTVKATYWHATGSNVLTVTGTKAFLSLIDEEDPKAILELSKDGFKCNTDDLLLKFSDKYLTLFKEVVEENCTKNKTTYTQQRFKRRR